jgi:hypothetical protein
MSKNDKKTVLRAEQGRRGGGGTPALNPGAFNIGKGHGPGDTRKRSIAEAVLREEWEARGDPGDTTTAGNVEVHRGAVIRQVSTDAADVQRARAKVLSTAPQGVGLARGLRALKARQSTRKPETTLVPTAEFRKLLALAEAVERKAGLLEPVKEN